MADHLVQLWIRADHWWITRALSPNEWGDLVEAAGEVLAGIVGDSQFQGMASPIPLELEEGSL
jgi:hypothetical protein